MRTIYKHLFSSKSQPLSHILIACDKFKFSLTSRQISQTIVSSLPQRISTTGLDLADGGEGSLQSIAKKVKGRWVNCQVLDPLFRRIQAQYYLSDSKEAFIQMSRASGLQLLKANQRNPFKTSTFGTGQMILHCLKKGISTINLLIGGSATNDAGLGVAQALGYDFIDENGRSLQPAGENLVKVKEINISKPQIFDLARQSSINVFTDVNNPFTGLEGASRVYSPQKGATPQITGQLEEGMQNIRQIFKHKYKIDVNSIAGSGAAGGLGGGCAVLLNSKISGGADLILSLNEFQTHLKKASLIITGEGKVDSQTMQGKLVKRVIQKSLAAQKPVLVICAFAENQQHFHNSFPNVELVELLNMQQKLIVDPQLTRKKLSNFIINRFK